MILSWEIDTKSIERIVEIDKRVKIEKAEANYIVTERTDIVIKEEMIETISTIGKEKEDKEIVKEIDTKIIIEVEITIPELKSLY